MYIGDIERPASIVEDPLNKVDALSISYGRTSVMVWTDERLGISKTIDSIAGNKWTYLLPRKYALIFIMKSIYYESMKEIRKKKRWDHFSPLRFLKEIHWCINIYTLMDDNELSERKN